MTLKSRAAFSLFFVAVMFLGLAATALRADIDRFVGNYSGSAEVDLYDGTKAKRDMSVSISESKTGFIVRWSSTTHRDGRAKEKSYRIVFVPTERSDVFAAAMKLNVFGHQVPLDPMKGEPYVWARIKGDTLSVYSLFVNGDGGYELQQFDRSLVEGGLQLEFQRVSNGVAQRSISTFLTRD